MMLSQGVQDYVVQCAERGQAFAESVSPVLTGDYKSKFHVRPALVGDGLNRRAGAVLENTSDHAIYVEYHDGYRILQRAIDVIEKG